MHVGIRIYVLYIYLHLHLSLASASPLSSQMAWFYTVHIGPFPGGVWLLDYHGFDLAMAQQVWDAAGVGNRWWTCTWRWTREGRPATRGGG